MFASLFSKIAAILKVVAILAPLFKMDDSERWCSIFNICCIVSFNCITQNGHKTSSLKYVLNALDYLANLEVISIFGRGVDSEFISK